MNDKKLKNGIDEIKKIVMTDAEKKHVFENIFNISKENREAIKSPWSFYSFISMTRKSDLVYYIVIPLIIVLSSGSVVFASQTSLPDSILYPLKVKVIEPIEGALAFSPKARAKHESSLASKRLVEAETLIEKGRLDVSSEKKINNLLDDHALALGKAINKMEKAGSEKNKEDVNKIINDFSDEMSIHAEKLEAIINDKDRKKDKERDEYRNENEYKDKDEEKDKDNNEDDKESKNEESGDRDDRISDRVRYNADNLKYMFENRGLEADKDKDEDKENEADETDKKERSDRIKIDDSKEGENGWSIL